MHQLSETTALTAEWDSLAKGLQEACTETLGFKVTKHQDWFDDNIVSVQVLLRAKNEAYAAKLGNPNSTALHNKWKELRSHAQKELLQMENDWWTSSCVCD